MNLTARAGTAIKIAMVDDHVLLRDALANIVNEFADCSITLLASHGKELFDKLQPSNLPDLVLLDLNMPELDGYETARRLRTEYPSLLVMVLTMYDSEIALIQLLQAGVRGFLKKDVPPAELKHALQCIVANGNYCSQTITSRLFNLMKTQNSKNSVWETIILNENEISFLKLVATELTYKEMAKKMEISPRTIDNYRDALFLKLNVKSRVGLAMYAVKTGIVTINY